MTKIKLKEIDFDGRLICEVTRKDGSKHELKLSEAQLVELYKRAEKDKIKFEVELADYEFDDFIITQFSAEVFKDEVDLYIQEYNFNNEVDFHNVIARERCETMSRKAFEEFKNNNKNMTWER